MFAMNCAFNWLNTEQIMSQIGRAEDQNEQNLEELQKNRKLLEHNRLRPSWHMLP